MKKLITIFEASNEYLKHFMPTRYFVQLSYKGTRYHGWQVQPNAISVQGVLEHAFSTLTREKISLTGAGRTDTGVHASYFMAHFDANDNRLVDPGFVFRLNRFLPNDIAIRKIRQVPPDAHARFDALSRTYQYFIHREKDPFLDESSTYYHGSLDVVRMNNAAALLFNYADFTSFSRLHTDVKTNNCNIMKASWTEESNRLIFTIKADRFLRNMVRAIVGTLLDVGRSKLAVDDFRKIIEARARSAAGASAPPQGLFLVHIAYPEYANKSHKG